MTLKVLFPLQPTNSRVNGKEKWNIKAADQIKSLTGETTLVRWIKVLSQTLMHLNDQPGGPVALHEAWGQLPWHLP